MHHFWKLPVNRRLLALKPLFTRRKTHSHFQSMWRVIHIMMMTLLQSWYGCKLH